MFNLIGKFYSYLKKIYYKFPTKLLALIIFFGIIFFIFSYTKNNFINNKANLIINSNLENYNVFLQKNINKFFEKKKKCLKKICKINNIIPEKYTLILEKKGYKKILKKIFFDKKENKKIKINFEKKFDLKQIFNNKKNLTNDEKIELLKQRLKKEKILKIKNNIIKSKENKKQINIFFNNNLFLSFPKNKNFKFDKIYMTNNEVYIFSGKKIYFLDLITKNIFNVDFENKINYIKKINNNYLIITNLGSFIFNPKTNKIQYFYLFKDFIILDKNIFLGIIYKEEKQKLKNLNLKNFGENIILKYNFKTKKKIIIYKTPEKIDKIYKKNNNIFFEISNKKYLLK